MSQSTPSAPAPPRTSCEPATRLVSNLTPERIAFSRALVTDYQNGYSDRAGLVLVNVAQSNHARLHAAVDPVIADSPARLVLDVSGLRFADSAAIALWVTWANAVGELELRHPSALLRRVIETIDLDAVHSKGYAFQVEIAYRVRRAGFRVVEVPITFVDRERGVSKMSRAIMVEAAWKVPLLRLRTLAGRL